MEGILNDDPEKNIMEYFIILYLYWNENLPAVTGRGRV